MAYLEIKNLTKSFDNKIVLNSFSCTLEKGETLCLIGDSGSGKTTFLRLLNCLEKKDKGTIVLNGEVLQNDTKCSSKEKRNNSSNFGLVFQSYNLFPQYTALDNILLPLKSKLKKVLKKTKLSKAQAKTEYEFQLKQKFKEIDNLFKSMNLVEKKNSYPFQLSGGESQRVAIIRALILDPKVICFDEPTSALDPRLKREIANIILNLKKQGQTIIVVTHEMELAYTISDKVIFLEKGNIIEQGSKDILVTPKSNELKYFLSLNSEENEHVRREDVERKRADRALFSLSQD